MKRSLFNFFCFLFTANLAFAQATVSGRVTNHAGDVLGGAVVHVDGSLLGAVTNGQGIYTLRIKPGNYVMIVEHLGYKIGVDTVRIEGDMILDHRLKISPLLSKEFIVEATRAGAVTPMTYQNLDKEALDQNNLAQDLPILLNQTVSAVTTSDAGAGVGYTGIRIRGSDATRINVTVNGVPLNDPESHGVFWVNMPDFASSTENIQIQRGVGTSSNGAAAFGASVNLETSGIDSNAFVELNNSYGSFQTRRHNAVINTGLFNDHFNAEARFSYIASNGYIDRSASALSSYYLSGGYYGKQLMVKAIAFSGDEMTQQAWYGTPAARISGDVDDMLDFANRNYLSAEQTDNLLESGRTYNYYQYDNEIDNYGQDHYQLISGWQLSPSLYLNVTGHYTRGKGFFEQFKANDDFEDYGIAPQIVKGDSIYSSDIIVRRWLDNHFFGGVYSLQYRKNALQMTLGGGLNRYLGDHFGEVVWSEIASDIDIRQQYYSSNADKVDGSSYLKAEWSLDGLTLFGDVQGRYIDYKTNGLDNDQRPISVDQQYLFINPKGGASLQLPQNNLIYASLARGSREPVRSDFIDAAPGDIPQPEFLTDVEAGWSWNRSVFDISLNAYFMHYKDQLVLTGEVNDVGAPVRTNVPNSYRAGAELAVNLMHPSGFFWSPNLTWSQNKIKSFDEVIIDYATYEEVRILHENVDIAFSPSFIAGSQLGFKSNFGFEVALLTKYVGQQYLDNTQQEVRSIDPYIVNDLRLSYRSSLPMVQRFEWTLLINNIANAMYASNGYTYSYIYEEMITENFYYPQAGINWLLGLKIRI
ncbi:MAG: TonB-dependent receptor [Flavobacteriales bacterium]|nr:TonB-dependent receptor [Flavobacteriales bacterium]